MSNQAVIAGPRNSLKDAVFPDLHHKMSKKIAQLTRVIYHLNTINENHESEIASIKADQELAIEGIMRDSSNRLRQLELGIATKRSSMDLEYQLIALQKKYEAEKNLAQRELEELNKRATAREKAIAEKYKQETDKLRSQLEEMNIQFSKKIEEFEDTTRKLEDKRSSSVEDIEKAVAAAKHVRDNEIANLVRVHNEKYQAMLIEQLSVQQSLKEKASTEMRQAMEDLESQRKKELTEQQQQHEKAMAEKLRAMNATHEEQLKKQRNGLMEDLEKVLANLAAKNAENKELSESMVNAKSELEQCKSQQRAEIEAQANTIEITNKELESTKREIEILKRQQQDSYSDVDRLQSMLLGLNQRIADAESNSSAKAKECEFLHEQLQQVKAELEAMQNEHSVATSAKSNDMNELEARAAIAERDAESLRAEVNAMGLSLSQAREELKATQKNAQKSTQELERWIAASSMDKEAVSARMREAVAEATKATRELNELRDTFIELKSKYELTAQQKEEIQKLFESEKKQLISQNENKISALKLELNSSAEKLNEQILQLENELISQKAELEGEFERKFQLNTEKFQKEIAKVIGDSEETIRKLNQKHEKQEKELSEAVNQLEQKIQTLSESFEIEKNQLHQEISRMEGKCSSLSKELEQKKSAFSLAESVQTSLKSQVESLREELQSNQLLFSRKLELALNEKEQEMKSLFIQQKQASSEETTEMIQQIQANHSQMIGDLKETYSNIISELESKIESLKEESKFQKEQHKLQLENVENIWQDKLNTQLIEKQNLQNEFEIEIAKIKENNLSEFDKLMQLHKSEMQRKELNWESELQRQLTSTNTQYQQLLAISEEKNVKEKEELQGNFELLLSQKLMQLKSDYEMKVISLQKEFDRLRENDNKLFTEQLNEHMDNKNLLESKLSNAEELLKRFQIDSDKEKLRTALELSKLQNEIANQKKQFELQLETNREAHQVEIDQINNSYIVKMQKLNQEVDLQLQESEEKYFELQNRFNSLELLYSNRPSRPEDLQIISQLQQQLLLQEQTLTAHNEEMKKLKREMLNREDMYNDKFGSRPVVGIMQVIKADAAAPIPSVPQPPPQQNAGSVGNNSNNANSNRSNPAKLSGQSIAPLPTNKPQYLIPSPNQRGIGGLGGLDASMGTGFHGVGISGDAPAADKRRSSVATRTSSK